MTRESLADLTVFAEVAEAASFSRAAARLGVSRSALSHSVRGLEARLGVRLLNRTTRSVRPTAAGERLLARLRPSLSEIAEAMEEAVCEREEPVGLVRLSAHRTIAFQAVLPRLRAFAESHPRVTLELAIQDGLVDIVAEGFDAGLRHGPMLQPGMISLRISGPQPTVVVAAPEHFARCGAPGHPRDLAGHACLSYRYASSGRLHRWSFARGGERAEVTPQGPLITNDVDVLLEAALRGAGVAQLSRSQAEPHLASGALVGVLDDWCLPTPDNHVYYPSRRQNAPALRALVAALRTDDEA